MKKNTPTPYLNDLNRFTSFFIRAWHDANAHENKKDSLSTKDIREIALRVEELSKGLTRERNLIGSRYMNDTQNRTAYLIYFWQISYIQARIALEQLSFKPQHALDLGCGPGPVSMALADCGADVVAADYSKDALTMARDIAQFAHKNIRFISWDAIKNPLPEGRYDCITISHLLNELWETSARVELRADLIDTAGELLTPNGRLIIIEPALLATSRETLQMRDELTKRGWFIQYPCPGEYPCPALNAETGMCHTAFSYEKTPLLESIIRNTSFKKEFITMTLLIIGRHPIPHTPAHVRVVSEIMTTKNGRYRIILCGNGKRISLSVAHTATPSLLEQFRSLSRGDLIAIHNAEMRENGMGLIENSLIEKIQ